MMKKLPEPDITGATGLLDNAIDRKKNIEQDCRHIKHM